MSNERKIIHLDLDAFFCAVEELENRALVGLPIAVGGQPHQRGVISSCSYAARLKGVHSAMPSAHALRLCPELLILPPRHNVYSRVSKNVMSILRSRTDLIEQISIDEAFMDFTSVKDSITDIAKDIQATINHQLHLPCSIGAATNKLVAKIANDYGKSAAFKSHKETPRAPNAITIVAPGDEARFLAPLPVKALWGVGPKTAQRLNQLGIHSIGDLAKKSIPDLVRIFGKNGYSLSLHANGIDDSPIITYHEAKSISQEITYAHDVRDSDQLRKTIQSLGEKVCKRLRKINKLASMVKIKIRWPDFTTITKQKSLGTPTDQDEPILSTALELFDKIWKPGKAVRLIGIGVSGLEVPTPQLSLWESPPAVRDLTDQELQSVIESLRNRYGEHIIQRATQIKKKE